MPVTDVKFRGNGATVTLDDNSVLDLVFEKEEGTNNLIVGGLPEDKRQEVINYFSDPNNYTDVTEVFPWIFPTALQFPVDLSVGFRNGTQLLVDNTAGLDVTLPPVNLTEAGLMTAADKVKLDGIEPLAKDDQNAIDVPVSPAGNLTSTDVQNALLELQADIDTLIAFTGPVNFIAGNGAPLPATGNNGDFYIDVVTGDIYGPKTGGAWGGVIGNAYLVPLATVPPPASTNAVGQAGISTNAAREDHQHPVQQADVTPVGYVPISYPNPPSGDVEAHIEEIDIVLSGLPQIPLIRTGLTFAGNLNVAAADLQIGGSTINTLGAPTGLTTIAAPVDGIYEVSTQLSFTGTSTRGNLGIIILVNAAPTFQRNGSNYLRNGSGHNESGDSYQETVALGAGDTISIRLFRQAGGGTMNLVAADSSLTLKLIDRL